MLIENCHVQKAFMGCHGTHLEMTILNQPVRSSPRWRTESAVADWKCRFFTSKIELRYVSRIVTKVFLGHFGYVKDVFNDFGVSKLVFVTIWSFSGLVSQGSMDAKGAFAGQSVVADRKSRPAFRSSKL